MPPRFDERPLLVYWEITQACDLACRHCRADAQPLRHPRELSTAEALGLIDRLARFEPPLPHIVFTGGDALKRPDLYELIAACREKGFRVALTPSATPLLTEEAVQACKSAGVEILGLSLDAPRREEHDAIRGIPGTFDRTLSAARWAREAGLPMQINSLVSAETADGLPALHDLAVGLGAERWSLFFLVEVGRGRQLTQLSPGRAEKVLRWIATRSRTSPLDIKTTEAPHYRRIVSRLNGVRVRGAGIRDGCGIMFISHTGEIFPSGFLPLSAGNVRSHDPVRVYRESDLFRSLRTPRRFKGRCGICEYAEICGGSRSRALAATGDPLESDPLCPYRPHRRETHPSKAHP